VVAVSWALQLPQSTVSRHLKVLYEDGWLHKRSVGTASLYGLAGDDLGEHAARLWALTLEGLGPSPTFTGDDDRLVRVLAERGTDGPSFFGRLGGRWEDVRDELFGHDFGPEALLSLVEPDLEVVDLGCGTGTMARVLAPLVRRVVAVDREPAMLEAARARLEDRPNLEFVEADVTDLPLPADSMDVALAFLLLHHVEAPARVLAEAARVLRPGGRVLVLDMVAHDHAEYVQEMGHRHLGFDAVDVERVAAAAGLTVRSHRKLDPETTAKGPGLFVAVLSV